MTGRIRVVWNERRYGFIKRLDNLKDVFVHFDNVELTSPPLEANSLVEFDVIKRPDPDDRVHAINVRVILPTTGGAS
jgi:cold shock CspA family protein